MEGRENDSWSEESRCKSKKSYVDIKDAWAALKKIKNGKEKRKYTPVRAYKCDCCSCYHLSHIERQHWLLNTQHRLDSEPATKESIQNRLDELTKIVELQKQEENGKPEKRRNKRDNFRERKSRR